MKQFDLIYVARFARRIPTLPAISNHGLGGQTASEVIFDLRIELLDLKNHKIDTHIVTSKRPWPPRPEVMTSEVEAVICQDKVVNIP